MIPTTKLMPCYLPTPNSIGSLATIPGLIPKCCSRYEIRQAWQSHHVTMITMALFAFQIDLVPTLATILGVPIPYSNLGLINFNIVPDIPVPYLNKFQTLLLHSWQNAQQIYRYFFQYAFENKRTFNVEEMDRLETDFILLSHRVQTIYNEAAFKNFVRDLNVNLRDILGTCREIWVRFDPTQMSHGLLFSFLPVFFIFLLVNNSRPVDYGKIFKAKETFYVYLINVAAGVFGYRYYKNFGFKTEEHGVIFFTAVTSAAVLSFHVLRHWTNIASNWAAVRRFAHMPTRLLLFAAMAVFFSNSFVIQEAKSCRISWPGRSYCCRTSSCA